MPTVSGIYAITCVVTGKHYVGSALNIRRRCHRHRSELRSNKHHSKRLQAAWNKFGEGEFVFSVLEFVGAATDLLKWEQFHIDRLKSAGRRKGYNISPTAGSCAGHRQSEIHKARIAAAHLGKKASAETRAKLSIAQTGRVTSDETRAKLSAALRGVKKSPESIAKFSASRKGVPAHPNSVAAIKAANTGRKHTPEWKEDAQARMAARELTDEQRFALGKGSRGKKQPPEHIAKRVSARALADSMREFPRTQSPETKAKRLASFLTTIAARNATQLKLEL